MKKTLISKILLIGLVLIISGYFGVSPALADGPTPENPGLDDTLSELENFTIDAAESLIKFLIYLGGVVFTIGFVYFAFKGQLGQALGNQMQVSNSMMQIGSLIIAFIFLLSTFGIGKAISRTVAEKFSDPANMTIPNVVEIAESGAVNYEVASADTLFQVEALENVINSLVLRIIQLLFVIGGVLLLIALVKGGFDTQLGVLFGGSTMIAAGIQRAAGAVISFIILAGSYQLAQYLVLMLAPKLLGPIAIN